MSSNLNAPARILLSTLLFSTTASSHAADGTIRIRGSVTEPVCSVTTSALRFEKEALQKAGSTRSSTAPQLELNMYCNAKQAIQLKMIQLKSKIRAGFETGIAGVRMKMRYAGREVGQGEAMSITLPQRMAHQIRMETRLETAPQYANVPAVTAGTPQAGSRGAMLVAIDYQ
jgi:type 1 fimbria pilin